MVVFIAANYPVAKNIAEKMYNDLNISFCAVEAEYGDGKLSTNDIGISASFAHHKIGKDYYQPCLAYQNDISNYSENFIISHVDTDTIFGIGWISGMFNNVSPSIYEKLKELSLMISINDNFGYHSIPKDTAERFKKEWDVILSYVSHAKKMISKSKFKNYYNCSNIILKCLYNILKCLHYNEILNKKYSLIDYKNDPENKLDISNDIVHVFKKRTNDFKDNNHSFIIVWDFSVSIYGRDIPSTMKYFPEGINKFLSGIFPESGGHFSAAGTPRKVKVSKKGFDLIMEKFNERIKEVTK